MAAVRNINCDCGGVLEKRRTYLDHFETDAMVCNKCKFTTLTKGQARKYAGLKKLHDSIDASRKVIKIGNSMGITLPEQIGAKVGGKVRIEAISPKSFKIEVLN